MIRGSEGGDRARLRPHTGAPGRHRTLILLRHAKSDWSERRARPRATARRPRGRRQAPEAGRWLAAHVDRIDLAVVSTARAGTQHLVARLGRARRRAAGAARRAGCTAPRAARSCASCASWPEDLTTVVLVGHNPGLEDLASTLAGHWVSMPTSALAVLTVAGTWAEAGPTTAQLEHVGPAAAASLVRGADEERRPHVAHDHALPGAAEPDTWTVHGGWVRLTPSPEGEP